MMDTPPIQNNYAYIILEVEKIREAHQNLGFLKKTPVNTEESPIGSNQRLLTDFCVATEKVRKKLVNCDLPNHT